jgi:type II secretory pathway pseudopilin PulG
MFVHSRKLRSGFTLMEALLASVILAMAIASIVMPFTAAAQQALENTRQTLAANLAQEMMEEILAQPFHDEDEDYQYLLGPDPGENTRNLFDNIDDYHGYTEAIGAIKDYSGAVLGEATDAGLSREVTVAYVYIAGQSQANPPNFLCVTVKVLHEDRPVAELSRLVYEVR